MVRTKIVEDNEGMTSTCTTDLQVDFQGHLKGKLIFFNKNPDLDKITAVNYAILLNVKFLVLSESGVKNRGLLKCQK